VRGLTARHRTMSMTTMIGAGKKKSHWRPVA